MPGTIPTNPSGRDSIGAIMHEFVDSFPLDMEGRASISDLGKVLFAEGQKQQDRNGSSNTQELKRKPYVMPAEIKGIPRQKQQDVSCVITASGRVALPQGSVRKLLKAKGKAEPKRWSPEEDEALRNAVKHHGERNWKSIAEVVPGRNHTQCLQRWTKVLAPGLVKGHWRPDEDDLLRQLVAEGRKNWGQVATRIPGRTSKQCRERWYNHLDPNIVRGEYSAEEDRIILEAQVRLGNRWSAIAAMLPGRTEDAVKIRWKSLCRTKSGRGRRNQSDKIDENGNPTSAAIGINHPHGYPNNSMHSNPNLSHHQSQYAPSSSLSYHHTTPSMVNSMQNSDGQSMHHSNTSYGNAPAYPSYPNHQVMYDGAANSFTHNANHNISQSSTPLNSASNYHEHSLSHFGNGGNHSATHSASANLSYQAPYNYTNYDAQPMESASAYSRRTQSSTTSLGFDSSNQSGAYHQSPNSNLHQQPKTSSQFNPLHNANSYNSLYDGNTLSNSISTLHGMNVAGQTATGVVGNSAMASNITNPVATYMSHTQKYHDQSNDNANHSDGSNSGANQSTHLNGTSNFQAATFGSKLNATEKLSNNVAANFIMSQQAQRVRTTANSTSESSLNHSNANGTGMKHTNNIAAAFGQQLNQSYQSASNTNLKTNTTTTNASNTSNTASVGGSAAFNPAASFVQKLSTNQMKPNPQIPSMHQTSNIAASFVLQQQSKASANNMKKSPIYDNEAASSLSSIRDSITSRESISDAHTMKKPKLPLSMDAARASAVRRLRQSESARQSMDISNDVVPRISVSDLNLNEFGPMDELWRVSDDMNRLSL